MILKNIRTSGVLKNVNKGKLGVIIPFRYSPSRVDSLERISKLFEIKRPMEVLMYLVDSGSEKNISKRVEELCIKHKVEYIYVDSKNELFSIGKARDIGVIFANTDFVTFQDIDYLPYEGFYDQLLMEIENEDLPIKQNDFLVIPILFLTEQGSLEYVNTPVDKRRQVFLNYYLHNENDKIQFYALSSSILIHRLQYLSLGGHNNTFRGHGFEDFELLHRASTYSNKFPRPQKYYEDMKKWSSSSYEGFRSMFRLYGDILMMKGVFLCHVWHPTKTLEKSYTGANKRNAQLLKDSMQAFDNKREAPQPLPDIYKGKTLALGEPNSNFYKSIQHAMPHFGIIEYKSEFEFDNINQFIEFFEVNKFSRALMPNPYGNEKRLSIYHALKERDMNFVVMDRGALPDSVFFDNKGFNAESSSYDPKLWDVELSPTEIDFVDRYMDQQRTSDSALEKQGMRLGSDTLAEKLYISPYKKVLFIPFQRPSDTVIKYFSGSVPNMDCFLDFVDKVAANLSEGWVVLAKKHPLETEQTCSEKIILVDESTHINDLLELSDAVLLINSGVGVLSMIYGKPVLYVGEVFYGHPEINRRVKTPEEVVSTLENLFEVNMEKVGRFIYYLVKRFYSFGETENKLVRQDDGSFFNVTRNINFYDLKIPGDDIRRFCVRTSPEIGYNSPLFDRYRFFLENRKESSKKIKQLVKSESKITWGLRQFKKLFLDPKKFKNDFNRWMKKRKK